MPNAGWGGGWGCLMLGEGVRLGYFNSIKIWPSQKQVDTALLIWHLDHDPYKSLVNAIKQI